MCSGQCDTAIDGLLAGYGMARGIEVGSWIPSWDCLEVKRSVWRGNGTATGLVGTSADGTVNCPGGDL
jgi:hypothetical protein